MHRLLIYKLLLAALFTPLLGAVVIDRIAVIVDTRIIKHSDIDREIRVTSYINSDKLDFSPAARKKAAERLIDQSFIRREIEIGRYPAASDADTDKLQAETRRTRPALPRTYGLTDEDLRRALRWQLTVMRFIEQRFPQQAQGAPNDPFIAWLDEERKNIPIRYKEEELR